MLKTSSKVRLMYQIFFCWFHDNSSTCSIKSLKCLTAMHSISKHLQTTIRDTSNGDLRMSDTRPSSDSYTRRHPKMLKLIGRRSKMSSFSTRGLLSKFLKTVLNLGRSLMQAISRIVQCGIWFRVSP